MRIHKRPDPLFPGAVATLLFLALCAWLGAGLRASLLFPAAPAAPAAAPEKEIRLHGIVLRQERLLCSRRRVTAAAADGKRLAAGGEIAVAAGGHVLSAETSAVFFADWDGLEWLDPGMLSALDVPAAEALLKAKPLESAGAYGRLVSGRAWYYAALTDAPTSPDCGRCLLRFEELDRALPARLLSVSEEQEGRRALLFRLTEGGADCLSLRKCDAALLLSPELPLTAQLMNQEKEG